MGSNNAYGVMPKKGTLKHRVPFFGISREAISTRPKGTASRTGGFVFVYSFQRLNTSEAFVPPKPKEFDSTYSMGRASGVFGT